MMSTRSRTQIPLATATVGPQSWSDATVKEIKISQAAVEKTDTGQEVGRSFDALPSLRDNCAQQSNTVVHQYVRECRISLVKLRDSFLETNEEVKSLIRGKEALEKQLEHIRKDIALNKMSTEIRCTRPSRERGRDGADNVMEKEFRHLHQLKKALELQLRSVQKQLQVLDQCRKRLSAVIQERNRVLDLLCHAVSSVNGRASRGGGRISRQDKTMTFGGNGMGYTRQVNGNVAELLGTGASPPDAETRSGTPPQDPLGPFTPEAAAAIAQAREARQRSQFLRKDIRDAIENTQQLQQAAHRAVNDGLNQKVAETITLKQHLTVAAGENRHSIHRAQRWYDSTEKALGYTIGPELQSDLETREKLTRPLVRVFQRHPGTNLPEAQGIIRGAAGLDESLLRTSRNIGLLQLAQGRLQGDIRHKHAGASVDSAIVRGRRRLANHRWVMGSV